MIKRLLLFIITVLGFVLLFWTCKLLIGSQDTLKWPHTKGQVISSTLDIKDSTDGILGLKSMPKRLYSADVQYQYVVDGGLYTADRVSFQNKETRKIKDALKVMNKYRHQHEVNVYYNPADPQQAILEPANVGDITLPLLAGGLLAFWGLIILYPYLLELNFPGIESYLRQGYMYQKQRKHDEALFEFNKIIESKPSLAMGYISRGGLFLQQKNWDQAIADFDQAIAFAPDNGFVYFNRAQAYMGKWQWDNAWKDIQKAMSLGVAVDPEIQKTVHANLISVTNI